MPSFEIPDVPAAIKLKPQVAGGQTTYAGPAMFSVTNKSGQQIAGRLSMEPQGNAKADWFEILGEKERPFAGSETQKITVNVKNAAGDDARRLQGALPGGERGRSRQRLHRERGGDVQRPGRGSGERRHPVVGVADRRRRGAPDRGRHRHLAAPAAFQGDGSERIGRRHDLCAGRRPGHGPMRSSRSRSTRPSDTARPAT